MSTPKEAALFRLRADAIDTTPTCQKPPDDRIEAAARSIPDVMTRAMRRDDGQTEMIASRLAKDLERCGHDPFSAEWAIHNLDLGGMLRADRITMGTPSFVLPGGRQRFGGEEITVPIPVGKPAPFDTFKVISTPNLWGWWQTLTAQRTAAASGAESEADTLPQQTAYGGGQANRADGCFPAFAAPVQIAPVEGQDSMCSALSWPHPTPDEVRAAWYKLATDREKCTRLRAELLALHNILLANDDLSPLRGCGPCLITIKDLANAAGLHPPIEAHREDDEQWYLERSPFHEQMAPMINRESVIQTLKRWIGTLDAYSVSFNPAADDARTPAAGPTERRGGMPDGTLPDSEFRDGCNRHFEAARILRREILKFQHRRDFSQYNEVWQTAGVILHNLADFSNYLPDPREKWEAVCDLLKRLYAAALDVRAAIGKGGDAIDAATVLQDIARAGVGELARVAIDEPAAGGNQGRGGVRKSVAEHNVEARKYLRKHPQAGPRELMEAIGCGAGTVYKLPAYQAVADAKKTGRKPKAVSLTKEMADATPTKAEGETLAKLIREQERDKGTNKVNSRERT
ncbi:MAG: hypothetical protein NTY19_27690 [Planctomycetota bacterium]|nr:hypothetical protein [Planctomycetota bacterium]